MSKIGFFLRAPFNYDVDKASEESGLACDPDEGMTQQQFADECDINKIVERFGLTGQLPENLRMPVSGDFTGVTDFHSAMNIVRLAEEEFMRVPAKVRERFGNDPGALMAFLDDPGNRDEAVKLGLVNPPAEKTRDVVQAVDELAAKIVVPKA